MPVYEYKCDKCGITVEYERGFDDTTTPICCGIAMGRVWSAPAVKFNGTGFYSTGG